METGTVSIIGRSGSIDTARPPSPVVFDAAAHTDIVNGEPVYFTRIPGHPREADGIWPAAGIKPLYSMAGPPDRLTHQAHAYLLRSVAGFVDAARLAPTEDAAAHHRRRAEAAMRSVAGLAPKGNVRVGIQAVRNAIDGIRTDHAAR
jgi:hypothetical protein